MHYNATLDESIKRGCLHRCTMPGCPPNAVQVRNWAWSKQVLVELAAVTSVSPGSKKSSKSRLTEKAARAVATAGINFKIGKTLNVEPLGGWKKGPNKKIDRPGVVTIKPLGNGCVELKVGHGMHSCRVFGFMPDEVSFVAIGIAMKGDLDQAHYQGQRKTTLTFIRKEWAGSVLDHTEVEKCHGQFK